MLSPSLLPFAKSISSNAEPWPYLPTFTKSISFLFRKCQWSPETEKSSNWTLSPYKTSFKNKPFKKYEYRLYPCRQQKFEKFKQQSTGKRKIQRHFPVGESLGFQKGSSRRFRVPDSFLARFRVPELSV
jgi:hypothetical protein